MALMDLFSGQQRRNRHREKDLWTRWEERREERRRMERVTQKFTIPCVKQITNRSFLCDSGTSNRSSATG